MVGGAHLQFHLLRKAEVGGSQSEAKLGKVSARSFLKKQKQTNLKKILKAEDWGMAQMVALSSVSRGHIWKPSG
jgi:hypothetical protein